MNNSIMEASIELAIDDLNRQLKPNFHATAKKYGLITTTLMRRYNSITMSREAAKSEYWQTLTDVQEEVLIEWVNQLTDWAIPPTPQIVKNLVEELIKAPLGKNWVGGFIKQH